MGTSKHIETFRDLHLLGPAPDVPRLIDALKRSAVPPWRHAAEKHDKLGLVGGADRAAAFEHSGTELLPRAGLLVVAGDSGMEVPNVVPLEVGELTFQQYNDLLEDFAQRVCVPAADATGFRVRLTGRTLDLMEHLPPEVALALRHFSGAINKTSWSHPLDLRRWFDFVIASHAHGVELNTGALRQWLHEVEGWPETQAAELASKFEHGRELLKRYDER